MRESRLSRPEVGGCAIYPRMRRLLATVAVILPALLQIACASQQEITVQRRDIQAGLAAKFPMEKDAVVVKAKLNSPEVYFRNGDLGVKLHYSGRYMHRLAEGEIEFRGPLTYRPDRGAFFMEKVEVVDFTVNRRSEANRDTLQAIIEHFVTEIAAETPIYKLNQREFESDLSDLLVKRLHTWGGGMIVTFGS
jgi:hypothetical protein